MTTRSPAAVGRYFRRPFLEAFVKVNLSLASRNSGLSTFPGPDAEQGGGSQSIPTRPSIQVSESQGSFCGEIPEKSGERISLLQDEEIITAGYRDLRQQRVTSGNDVNYTICSRPVAGSKPLYHRLLQMRHYTMSPVNEGGRWMRISGTYGGPLAPLCTRHPFLEGSVRFKSKKKMKRAKAKKKEVLQKIKRMRVFSKKRKEEMNPEERLEFRLEKGRKKIELIKKAIAKFPEQEIPPEDPDLEVLTPEQLHYLKKIGYKNKNYVPVGRRGIYGGTIQNIHLHWKKHETVQVEIAGFTKEEIKVMAGQLARLSGGLVIDIHQSNIVILYRGRNYKMPKLLIPMKTLDKRKALAKSKLEQSMKALLENDKKVENELAELRKENELRRSGEWVESKVQKRTIIGKYHNWQSEKLEDPDAYSEWSFSEASDNDENDSLAEASDSDDDDDSVTGLEVPGMTESSSLSSESDSDDDDDSVTGLEVSGMIESSSLLSESDSDIDSEIAHLEGEKAVGK